MPSLLSPVNLDGKDISQLPLPERLIRFQLAGVSRTAMKQPGIEYWHQEIRVNGFVIGQSFWNNSRQTCIECQTEESCAILYYNVAGDIHFEIGKGQEATLPAGQYGLLICPAQSPTRIHFPPEQHHGIQLSISIYLLEHLPGFQGGTAGLSIQSTDLVQLLIPFLPVTKPIRSIWNQYLFQNGKMQPDYLRLNEGCLKLLGRFDTDWVIARQQQQWKKRKEIRVDEVEAYLADHLEVESRHLTTEKMCAKKVGMSPYQFRKFWKERFGTTLTHYLLQSRMERARQLLLTNEGTPATIYLQVGYQDFSSFSRAFSAWYGFPPSHLNKGNR